MVVVRFQGIEHSVQQQQQQQQPDKNLQGATAMFKVPTQLQQAQVLEQQRQAAKRKWQESQAATTTLDLSQRPQQKLKTPPLTIFYGGSVNVYDNVPESMVRALMTLAAAKSSRPATMENNNTTANTGNSSSASLSAALGFGFAAKKQVPPIVAHSQQSNQFSSSSLMSLNSTSRASTFPATDNCTSLSLGSLSKPEEAPVVVQNASASAATTPPADLMKVNARTKMQLGLPQARRASIQRFLEKRKHKQIVEDDGGVAANAKPDVPHFLR